MASLVDIYFDYQIEYEKKYGIDTVVLMEIGSFFEVYGVDNENEKVGKAKEIANLLNIQLTRKDKSILENSRKNPLLCGVPTVSFERYLDTLLKLNRFTIVLVEQITPPPKVKRAVTKVISPGTCLDSFDEENNYLMSICICEEKNQVYTVGCSYIDISTGKNSVLEVYGSLDDKAFSLDAILKLIKVTNPKEILINTLNVKNFTNDEIVNYFELNSSSYHIYNDSIDKIVFNVEYQNEVLKQVFKTKSFLSPIEVLNLERNPTALLSYILMLKFVSEHDKDIIENIDRPKNELSDFHLYLGSSVLTQLNVIPNKLSEGESSINSVYSLLSKTSTPMGKRLLKDRLLNPILDIDKLNRRYTQIEAFIPIYKDLEKYLNEITDIERLHRKMSLNRLQPSEFANLSSAYESIDYLQSLLSSIALDSIMELNLSNESWKLFREFRQEYFRVFDVDKMAKFNLNAKLDESFFNTGINKNIDSIDFEIKELKESLVNIAKTISSHIEEKSYFVKIESNEKDGYHLSLTNAKFKLIDSDLLKDYKIKKLTNITKIKSEQITKISDRLIASEIKLSSIVKDEYLKYLELFYEKYCDTLNALVDFVSIVDVTKAIAKTSKLYSYTKPTIVKSDDSFLEAVELRHPLIERINQNSLYIPNTIFLGDKKYLSDEVKSEQIYSSDKNLLDGMLIYGTNASGKSSLMKSVGIALVLAQSGFFVPAKSFRFSLFESLFTRISGDDNIFKGLSSFAVEMVELRDILLRADKKSLVLGDEISHGTESTSAQAIVSSTIIDLADREAKFIFATHIHELSKMDRINNLKNTEHFHLRVIYDEESKKLTYDRKLAKGSGSAVYGLEVAKALNLDRKFLTRAYDIRDEIMREEDEITKLLKNPKKSIYNSRLLVTKCAVCGDLANEVHHILPQKLAINENIKHLPKHHKSNLVPLCKKHHLMVHSEKLKIEGFKNTSFGIELKFEILE